MQNIGRLSRNFLMEEDAVGVVEIILILVAIFTHDKSLYKTCIW